LALAIARVALAQEIDVKHLSLVMHGNALEAHKQRVTGSP